MLRKTILKELEYERKLLDKDLQALATYPDLTLTCSRTPSGSLQFFYRRKGFKKKHYLNPKNTDEIRRISFRKFRQKRSDALERNISLLELLSKNLADYDDDSLIAQLPKSYRIAVDFLRSSKDPGQASSVIQSENPKNRENLRIVCTNGLLVRSKDEMAIADELIRFNIEFRYEMRLELTRITTRSDGTAVMETVTRYPDFTIFLADGSVLYWERAGRFDDEVYRKDHFDKIVLYF